MNEDDAKRVSETCICLAVQSASRAVGRRFDEAFRHLGLNNWQFSLLMALSRSEPPSMSAIASALATDRTTITANLKPLERRGLVEVMQIDPDRRLRRVRLTSSGRDLLTEAVACWEQVNSDLLERLGDVDLKALRAGLLSVVGSARLDATGDHSSMRVPISTTRWGGIMK